MIKNLLALLLLLNFFVLLSPRSLWHECKHHVDTNVTKDKMESGSCFVCDYDLTTASLPFSFKFKANPNRLQEIIVLASSAKIGKFISQHGLRAPPHSFIN